MTCIPVSAQSISTPSAQPHGETAHIHQAAMGTVMAHRASGPRAAKCLQAVCREMLRIEGLLSRFLPGSDISRLNASAGLDPIRVAPDTFEVLARAVEFARCCPGCFDITIAPLVALWSRARESLSAPDEVSIQDALPLIGSSTILLDRWERRAGLRFAGQAVDLGGIGKGYAADRLREIFAAYGVCSACSNLGGHVLAVGARPDGMPWQVGIQHPRRESALIGAVSAVDQSVVTSGDYQRFFIDRQGKRRHHILDARSGYPAEAGLISVTIVSASSITADALSTLVFVAGLEHGLKALRNFPQTEAVLVDGGGRVYLTGGLASQFQPAEGVDVSLVD